MNTAVRRWYCSLAANPSPLDLDYMPDAARILSATASASFTPRIMLVRLLEPESVVAQQALEIDCLEHLLRESASLAAAWIHAG